MYKILFWILFVLTLGLGGYAFYLKETLEIVSCSNEWERKEWATDLFWIKQLVFLESKDTTTINSLLLPEYHRSMFPYVRTRDTIYMHHHFLIFESDSLVQILGNGGLQ